MEKPHADPANRVLIIEDEKPVSGFLISALQAHGYAVKLAENGKDGLQAAIDFRPEVIILDLGLPDQHGISVLKKLRQWSQTPVLVLTASDAVENKVEALDQGADDYLTKPFSVPELLARIRVAIRHSVPSGKPNLIYHGIELDLSSHSAVFQQKPLRLSATEFDILKCFLKHPGKVITHRTLLNEVWGPNSVEHTQYVRVYVGHLRKKLSEMGAGDLIVTEPGIGYRFKEELR